MIIKTKTGLEWSMIALLKLSLKLLNKEYHKHLPTTKKFQVLNGNSNKIIEVKTSSKD